MRAAANFHDSGRHAPHDVDTAAIGRGDQEKPYRRAAPQPRRMAADGLDRGEQRAPRQPHPVVPRPVAALG
jgi:hypothetical protein